jgi:hypothetical protein
MIRSIKMFKHLNKLIENSACINELYRYGIIFEILLLIMEKDSTIDLIELSNHIYFLVK